MGKERAKDLEDRGKKNDEMIPSDPIMELFSRDHLICGSKT